MAEDIAVIGVGVDSRQIKESDRALKAMEISGDKTEKAIKELTDAMVRGFNAGTAATMESTRAIKSVEASSDRTEAAIRELTAVMTRGFMLTTSATNNTTRAIDDMGIHSKKVAATTKASQAEMGAGLQRLIALAATYLSARQVIAYADAYTSLQNRLRLVTDTSEELAVATDDVFQIAQRSRSALDSVGALYSKIDASAGKLGLTMQDTAEITETVSKAVAMSGGDAATASAAILQLSQGLGSGVLRGDEFNSVMENGAGVVDALTRALGKDKGELRALAEQGRLTSEIVIKALQEQADEVEASFSKTEATVAQSAVGLGNAFTMLLGRFNEITGASSYVSEGIQSITESLEMSYGELRDAIQLYGSLAAGAASAGSVFLAYNLSIKAATASQILFNRVVMANPYVLVVAAFAGLGVAATKYIDSQLQANNAVDEFSGSAERAAKEAENFEQKLTRLDVVSRNLDKNFTAFSSAVGKMELPQITAEIEKVENVIVGLERARARGIEGFKAGRYSAEIVKDYDMQIANERKKLKELNDVRRAGGVQTAADMLAGNAKAPKEKKSGKAAVGPTDAEISLMVSTWSDEATRAFESQFSDEAIDAYINTIAEEHQTVLAMNEEFRQMDLENEQKYADAKATISAAILGTASDLANNLVALAKASGEEQSTLGRYAVVAAKGIQIAMAIINAEAAANAVMASYALMASLNPIAGPGLIATGGTMSAVVRAMGYASAATIAATEIAGARAMGGQVQAGESYLVGERGPELLTMGMNSGNITPNHRMGGGKTTIINQTQGRIDNVEERRMPDGERILIMQQTRDMIVGEMRDPNSKTSRAFSANTTAQRRRA